MTWPWLPDSPLGLLERALAGCPADYDKTSSAGTIPETVPALQATARLPGTGSLGMTRKRISH
jgi:hypothetical protein